MKRATGREKAVIFALAAGYLATWKEAYLLSRDKAEGETNPESLNNSIVTRWKQREDITNSYNDALLFLSRRDQATRAQASKQMSEEERKEDNNRTEIEKTPRIDYYDPANQRKQINKIIAQSQDDPKTQLDAIKAIQQTQRDDRQAAKDNQIQRFYSPLRCHSCPLHEKEEERQRRKAEKG